VAFPVSARHALRVALSVAVGGGLLALAFRSVDLGRLADTVSGVRVELLLAAVAVDLGVFLAKALKWRLLVAPLRRLPTFTLYSGIAVGALVANLLPLRLDELVRSLYLARKADLPRSTALGTIVVERTIDVAILVGVVAVLAAWFGGEAWLVRGGLVLVGALGVVALTSVALARRRGRPARTGAVGPFWRQLDAVLDGLAGGLAVLPRGRRLAQVLGLGAAEWALTLVYLTVVLAAFGAALSPARALLLAAAGYLGFALPTGPAGLGGFEVLVKGALEAGLAMGPSRALGIALTLHALLVAPISLLGAAVVAREGGGRGETDAERA
jgi:uncharacterized membrane protein YbhN (UPF0104 family)